MRLHDGLGDGQPQSEAAAIGAGGVRPVKPVEDVGQLVGGDGIPLIFHPQAGVFPLPHRVQPDLRVGRGVFYGVVQQDGHGLLQLLPVAPHQKSRRNVVGQRVSRLIRHRLEPQGHIGRRVRQVRRGIRQAGIAPLHPGQCEHILHQLLHPAGLGADVVHILPLLRRGALLQQLCGGQDHRQGRFQLVAGVGQKLLLLRPCPVHRAGHGTTEHIAAGEQHRQRREADKKAAGQQTAEGGLLQRAVGKGDAGGQQPLLPQIAQVVRRQHALPALRRQRGGDDLRQRLLVRQIVVAVAGDADGAAGIDLRHKAGKSLLPRAVQLVAAAGLERLL